MATNSSTVPKKASEGPKASCGNCHKNSATGYCKQCTRFLCPECLDKHNGWQPFSTHEVIDALNPITESYPKYHQQIQADLTKVKTKVANVNTAVTNLVTREREVTEQGEDVKKQINTHPQIIIDLVQQSQRQLVQQVDTVVQQKIRLLTKQREEAETVLKQLKGCEEFVEQSLNEGTQQQILREKQNMVQVMTTVNQDVNPVVFQPIEEANITFTSNHTLVDKYEGIGQLKSKSFGKWVLVKNAYYFGKKSTITLNLQAQDGSPLSVPLSLISCELSSAGDSRLMSCDINETQSGNYDISFTPCTRGKQVPLLCTLI